MGPTPCYGARAKKNPQKADFAMKQTNICRLSGDITTESMMFCRSIQVVVIESRISVHVCVSSLQLARILHKRHISSLQTGLFVHMLLSYLM